MARELSLNEISILFNTLQTLGRHMSKGDKNVKKISTNRVF